MFFGHTNTDLVYARDATLCDFICFAKTEVRLKGCCSGTMEKIRFTSQITKCKTLASAGKELKDNFLKALAEREEANRSGKMTSVIFIRDHNTLGQEVSGYIDYAHRLKTQDFEPYFSGKKRLMPGRSDLCYYNWKTLVSTSNSSPNFEVIYDNPDGLLFKNKRDKKILNLDPLSGPGEDSKRTFLQSDIYIHAVIYDHNIRTV
uniref:Cilia- and flagella-associated protein 299 n=1 Tax=Amphilophus citrinellus TaxID=61819 RepID=A0A3Q0QWR9_AMPCI